MILNKNQEQTLLQTLGNCRWIYNFYLNLRQEAYKNGEEYQHITEAELKREYEWLKLSESTSLQNSRIDLQTAYKNFFRRIKNKNKTSLKFKSRHNGVQSFRSSGLVIKLEKSKIKIGKLGWFKIKQHREVVGKIKSVTVSFKNFKWFVSILVETDEKLELPLSNKKIGIDLGLKEFATISNGEVISNPRFLRRSEEKLKREQRKLSKRKKGSSNRRKQTRKVSKLHEHIRNQRADFLHKLSTRLINENQVICLEDLNVKGMVKNHKLAKSISDASWSSFVNMLQYKAEWYGREIIKINRWFPSSKMCSNCGSIKKDLTLADRIYKCNCGIEIDRDLNASINILNVGLKTVGTTGLAC